ncbi:MAG: metallothionein [Pseudomonadota bacterium]
MPDVTEQTCACNDCVCVVNPEDAVKKDELAYCSDACADGHADGECCGNSGCTCC